MNTLTRGVAVLGGAAMIVGVGAAITVTAADAQTTANTVTACTGRQLSVGTGQSQGGAGHLGLPITFRNKSGKVCSLHGYPGLDALSKKGTVLVHAERTQAGYLAGAPANKTVTLQPGKYASAFVEWVDMSNNGRACKTSHSIAVTAPNTTRTVHRAIRVGVCDLQVHPVTYGRSGSHQVLTHRQQARKAWIRASKASSAGDVASDFNRAASELRAANHDYSTQIHQLNHLSAQLLTGTHKQTRYDRHILRSLDKFFHTPKLFR